MGILIDTGVFIALERNRGAVDLTKWSKHGSPAISVITRSELMVGVYRANSEVRRKARENFVSAIFSNVSTIPIDAHNAEIHAKVLTDLFLSGTPIGPHDLWIAATALAHDLNLLTTN
jgi:tRNA(fMet)-specific endonuclease VapC